MVGPCTDDAIPGFKKMRVTGVKGSGLQVIQVFYGKTNNLLMKRDWQKSSLTDENGTPLDYTTAFVDNQEGGQGWESEKDNTAVPGQPYYCHAGQLSNLTKEKNEDGTNNFELTFEDDPSAVAQFVSSRFETYVVVTNFNGSGADRIVGMVTWGWNGPYFSKPMTSGTTATVVQTSHFSRLAAEIINPRYPNYKTTQ